MTIVDTSIWIEFFKGNVNYFAEIRTQIEHQKILACEPVFAELLQGVKNRREKEIIEQYWRFLPKAEIENCWIKAGNLSSEPLSKRSEEGLWEAKNDPKTGVYCL